MADDVLKLARKNLEEAEARLNALRPAYEEAQQCVQNWRIIVATANKLKGGGEDGESHEANGHAAKDGYSGELPKVERGSIIHDLIEQLKKEGKVLEPFRISVIANKIKTPKRTSKTFGTTVLGQVARHPELFEKIGRGEYRMKTTDYLLVD